MTIKENKRYEVLTTDGFKDFSTITKSFSKRTITLITCKGEITTTPDHLLQRHTGEWVQCVELKIGDILYNHHIVQAIRESGACDVYDLTDVKDTSSFIANDINVHNCRFLGSSQTLIDADVLLGLQARPPIKIWRDIRYYAEPKEGHSYIMTVDVSQGRGQDYSTFSVYDVTDPIFKLVALYRSNLVSPLIFPEYIVRTARSYNTALVIIENNDSGQVVCNAVYYDHEYESTFVSSSVKSGGIGVRMTKRVKRIGCSNLKDMIEGGNLEICDADLISELSSFEPHGDSFAAKGNNHDDTVMNAVLFAWFVSSDLFSEYSNHTLTDMLYSEQLREMEEDLPPFGILPDRAGDDVAPSIAAHQRSIDEMREWNAL
jgi:hypothetical protein